MEPIEQLRQEHDLIRTVMRAARQSAERISAEGDYDFPTMTALVEFFQNFTDRCHHAKEEELFTALRNLGQEDDLIDSLQTDHQEIRNLRRNMAAALLATEYGENRAILKLMDYLFTYSEFLDGHLDREDREFFPRAARMLGAQHKDTLTESFGRIENETIGEGAHEGYRRLAARLAGE